MPTTSDRGLLDLLQEGKPLDRSHAWMDGEPVAMFVQDVGGKVLWISLEAEKLFGVTLEEARGRCCGDILRCRLHCRSCPAAVARAVDHAQMGQRVDIRTAKGAVRACLVDAMPLGGRLVAVVLREVGEVDATGRETQAASAA